MKSKQSSFNALNGLLSFLRYDEKKTKSAGNRFNALNGLLSFLQKDEKILLVSLCMFQRPKRASFISTVSG